MDGHFVSRTIEPICIAEGNINAQCKRCNGYLGGSPLLYERRLREKIGNDRVDWLLHMYFIYLGVDSDEDLTEDERRMFDEKDKYYWIDQKKKYDKKVKDELHKRGWDVNPPQEYGETLKKYEVDDEEDDEEVD